MTVLFEDNHLIAIYKPHGVPSQSDITGEPSALELTKSWLKEKYKKPGNVFLGLIHRLDKPVEGVLLFGKTSNGASRLSEQFRSRTVEKRYEAWVEGTEISARRLTHRISWSDGLRKAVADPLGKEAILELTPKEAAGGVTHIEIDLITGRKHQIRYQLASEKIPVVGDTKYGATKSAGDGAIALICHSISFDHPVSKERVHINLSPELRCRP